MTDLQTFTIMPILGRKTDVPAHSPSLFQFITENVAATHDVGGINFDLNRKRGACTKSRGSMQLSNSANAQATKCLGLYELYNGTSRDHIIFDNGKCFIFDSSLDPVIMEDAGSTTFANSNSDLYSIIQVGPYMVFSDMGEHTAYKWQHGDSTLSKLIASGTEYKFRYLETFQRRVIGAYCIDDTVAPDISVRWSTSWPSTVITSLNFPIGNQLYIPNDDPIVGIKRMGQDRCYIYSENSIHAIDYYQDYAMPFRIRGVVDGQGGVNHHSIVNMGDRHLLYNKNYGFCEFRGNEFPYGGRPISSDIELDLIDINSEYASLIVGKAIPLKRSVCWAVPADNSTTPNKLVFYDIDTKQWTYEEKEARHIDFWKTAKSFTWNDLITALGGTGAIWLDAGQNTWADYASHYDRLVYANTDGHVYSHSGEGVSDGYRVEPALHFGDIYRNDLLQEIWFDVGQIGLFNIYIYHRSGATIGELENASWDEIPAISCNSPKQAVSKINKYGNLHQIKWGTKYQQQKFEVSAITFKYIPTSVY
jgi:hypothetical protein